MAKINEKAERVLGASIPSMPAGPTSIVGRTFSLNYKVCDFLESPSRKIQLNHRNPTIVVPTGLHPQDLQCLWANVKKGALVEQDTPIDRFTKNPDRLQRHLDVLKLKMDGKALTAYLSDVVNGSAMDGGYSKLEIVEAMLRAEERNPMTGRGGQNRPELLKILRDAIKYVESAFGGVSGVRRESAPVEGSSSGRGTPSTGKVDAGSILGLGK